MPVAVGCVGKMFCSRGKYTTCPVEIFVGGKVTEEISAVDSYLIAVDTSTVTNGSLSW